MIRRRYVAALAALTAALVGCSDDDDGSGAATTSPPATTEAPSTTAAPATTLTPSTSVPETSPPTTEPPTPPPTTEPATTTQATAASAEPAVTLTEVAALEQPVDLAWRDGDDGLYVVEQDGHIERIGGGGGGSTTVLDVSDLTEGSGEQGLLGLAFAPGGDVAYVNYTDNNGDTVISEHPVAPDGTFGTGDLARVVLQIDQPYDNHNGGGLVFGPDGFLYIGTGDGGARGDPERRATDLSSLLGKMLRIDPAIAEGQAYSVPPDNPFVGRDGAAPEIWSSGLRNPWRYSFDRETGDLWIADVGQGEREEINAAPATGGVDAGKGLSFGWSAFEGDERYNDDVPSDGHTPPISSYGHSDGNCSVSGGVRVRGGPVPALDGWYVYADYCSGQVWAMEVLGEGAGMTAGRIVELPDVESATAVVAGPAGEVYVLSRSGPVYRLDPA